MLMMLAHYGESSSSGHDLIPSTNCYNPFDVMAIKLVTGQTLHVDQQALTSMRPALFHQKFTHALQIPVLVVGFRISQHPPYA